MNHKKDPINFISRVRARMYIGAASRAVAAAWLVSAGLPQPAAFGREASRPVPELVAELKSRDASVMQRAQDALVEAGPQIVPQLVAAMRDRRLRHRLEIIVALMGPKAVPGLLDLMSGSDPVLRDGAGTALCHGIGPDSAAVTPRLIVCLQEPSLRAYCGLALVRAMGPKAKAHVPALLEVLKNPEPELRAYAAAALGQIGSKAKEAVPGLIVALEDSSAAVRRNALEALGKIGPQAKEALPVIEALLKGSEGEMRKLASEALENIHGS